MAFRIGTTALACLAILKTAGFTNENLPPPQQYTREEDYVAALVTAFDRADITGAQKADYIQLTIDSVNNGSFQICPFTLEDGTESVTLVPSGEECEIKAMDDVKKDIYINRLLVYLQRVKSFIQPVTETVFGFVQTASNTIRETVYTLKDALLATALSGYGGIGFLITIFKGSKSLYYYVMKYFLPSHEGLTNKIVQKNYKDIWKKSIKTIMTKQQVIRSFNQAKTDNETNIKMLRTYVEGNRTGVNTGTLRDSHTERSNHTEIGTEIDDTEIGTEIDDTEIDRGSTKSRSRSKSKSRSRSRSRSRGGKIKTKKIKTKKTKTKRIRTKKRKSR